MIRASLICVCLLAARAQQAPPKFDVVSIKPCKTVPRNGGSTNTSPGRVSLECTTMEGLIRNAYLAYPDGKPWPIQNGLKTPMPHHHSQEALKGMPAWVKSEHFTIDAKADRPAGMEMMMGPMMQTVLKERFKLVFHKERRDVPVFELAAAKGGAKLQLMKEGGCAMMTPADAKSGKPTKTFCGSFAASEHGGIDVYGVGMDHFCWRLSLGLDRDVINKTGLTDVYDFHLDMTFAELGMGPRQAAGGDGGAMPSASDPSGTLSSALRKLGLQLQPGKAPMDFLVIDHVEIPAGN